jgi:hypothetical protein
MSTPEEMNKTPKNKQREGIPLERILLALGLFGGAILIFMGTRTLTERVNLNTISVVGEWQAQRKPWRIEFKPDNTIVSSTGPSEPNSTQAWTTGKGKYKLDYFGTLWVTLEDGSVFMATPSPQMPNRFDLIEQATEGVTVFDRVTQPKPNPPAPPK